MEYDRKILLTPGPLTTSEEVKKEMNYDLGTRDNDYQNIVQSVRKKLLCLGKVTETKYSVILLQGSGTYGVESVLTSTISAKDKVLILSNGAYGERMIQICTKGSIPFCTVTNSMIDSLNLAEIEKQIAQEDITHVAYVHCETTAGVLNDISAIQKIIHKYHKISIVDATSSFGSMDINIGELDIDFLITSSNKCLHGVPGIAIIFAKKQTINNCKNISRGLSLDLYDQYQVMENNPGSFRFTSPTHVVLALNKAIDELIESGGIINRNKRYLFLQEQIRKHMINAGFKTLVPLNIQSPVITTYLYPENFNFQKYYDYFKDNGFLLYSGKLTDYKAFRVGNIGEITDDDLEKLLYLIDSYEVDYENR